MSGHVNSEATEGVGFVASRDGTKIAFEKSGTGPALVIIGGALSHRGGGQPLASQLSHHFTVYRYDRRGRGDSGDTKPYAIDRELEDLDALIEQAGNGVYVYGVSSGAALALRAAEKLGPQKVAKLAVYDPPYGQDPRDFSEQKDRISQLVRTGKPGDAATFFFSAIGTPPHVLEDMKRSPDWQGMSRMDFTLTYDYAVLGDGAVPESIAHITVPTLVMVGERSMAFMHPAADRVAQLVPNAERKTIQGQAHQAAPNAMAPLLIEFFDRGR